MTTCIAHSLFALVLGIVALGSDALDSANRKFHAGDDAGAAAAYEQILDSAGPSAAVLYNLGNTYQRLGRNGEAILCYERARLLTPRDPDVLANLAHARQAVAAFEEAGAHPRFNAALNYLSRNEWSWLVAGSAIVLGGLALLGGLVSLPRHWMRRTVMVIAVMAGLGMISGGSALYLRRAEAAAGIVLSDRATLRLSPFENAASIGTPGPGRRVHMRGKTGSFYYVDVAGANLSGWLAEKDVAAIIPEKGT